MKRIIVLVSMCVLILSTSGFAKMGHGLLPPGKWWHMPHAVKKLKITDDEKAFLDQLFLEKRKSRAQIKSEMETKKLDMEAMMEKEPFDEEAAMKQFESIQDTGKKMWKNKFKFVIEVRKLLGNERFMQLKSQFRRMERGRRGHGPHGHRGHRRPHGGPPPGPPGDNEPMAGWNTMEQ
jgi:Spy/CpxP family protein refolding chaperone